MAKAEEERLRANFPNWDGTVDLSVNVGENAIAGDVATTGAAAGVFTGGGAAALGFTVSTAYDTIAAYGIRGDETDAVKTLAITIGTAGVGRYAGPLLSKLKSTGNLDEVLDRTTRKGMGNQSQAATEAGAHAAKSRYAKAKAATVKSMMETGANAFLKDRANVGGDGALGAPPIASDN